MLLNDKSESSRFFFFCQMLILNKWPCRNYLEKFKNKNGLDKNAFLVIIKLIRNIVGSSLSLTP